MFYSQVKQVNLEILAQMVRLASVVHLAGRETMVLLGSQVGQTSWSSLDSSQKKNKKQANQLKFGSISDSCWFSDCRSAWIPGSTRFRWSTGSSWAARLGFRSPRFPYHPSQPGAGRALLPWRNQPHLWRILPAVRAGQRKGSRPRSRYDGCQGVSCRFCSCCPSTNLLPVSTHFQAQLAAACAGSAPCPSCSATSITSATLPPATTTLTGCPRLSPCPCPWPPSLERASSLSSAGAVVTPNLLVTSLHKILKLLFVQDSEGQSGAYQGHPNVQDVKFCHLVSELLWLVHTNLPRVGRPHESDYSL